MFKLFRKRKESIEDNSTSNDSKVSTRVKHTEEDSKIYKRAKDSSSSNTTHAKQIKNDDLLSNKSLVTTNTKQSAKDSSSSNTTHVKQIKNDNLLSDTKQIKNDDSLSNKSVFTTSTRQSEEDSSSGNTAYMKQIKNDGLQTDTSVVTTNTKQSEEDSKLYKHAKDSSCDKSTMIIDTKQSNKPFMTVCTVDDSHAIQQQQTIDDSTHMTSSHVKHKTDGDGSSMLVKEMVDTIRLDANQDDPMFLSPMSNDDFTCDSILRKSSSVDDNYQYDDGLSELLADMRKCIAYDQLNDRYFIKRITETGQVTVTVMNSRSTKDRLTKYTVKYCAKDNLKILEKNLYAVIDKYAIVGGLAYENEVFHDIRQKNNPNVLNVFYKWKYSSLPKYEKIDMDLIRPFFDLCENNIFNHRGEYCAQLYSWIAYILQCPGHRNDYGYIISGKPGTGKTTLINFIADLTDGYSIANVDDIGSVFGTFNSSREFKVFIGINDLYCSDSKFTWNMLKTPVTEDKFERRQQYETTRTAQNVNNIMITANSEFFNVEDFDRRWQCVKTVYDPRVYDRKYFTRMYDMLRDEKAMRHLYTFFIRLCLDEYEPGIIIPDSLSTENGYIRFIKHYRRQHENTKFTMTHLNTFWGEKSHGCENELLETDVLKCGEPLKAIYSQFVDWAIREGIQRKDIPDEKVFENDIKDYEDITLDNYFRIKGKSIKFKVIHFKQL